MAAETEPTAEDAPEEDVPREDRPREDGSRRGDTRSVDTAIVDTVVLALVGGFLGGVAITVGYFGGVAAVFVLGVLALVGTVALAYVRLEGAPDREALTSPIATVRSALAPDRE